MRTIEFIIDETKRAAATAAFATVLIVAATGVANAELCNTLASDNFGDVSGTTSIMVSPNGSAGECPGICTEWSKLCTSVLVGHNRCVAGLYKGVIKAYTKYCKMMVDPVEQAECKALVAEAKAEVKALLKADTALVKAQCAAYVGDCITYCVANS